jgi:hypothetical protein
VTSSVSPISRKQIERELRLELDKDARRGQIARESREFAHEVRATWISIWESMGPHPYETGDYKNSIEVHGVGRPTGQTRAPKGAVDASGTKIGGRFLGNIYAHYRVSTDNEHAGFIEYGTGPDNPDSRSPWGLNTPTPEFAPAAATAAHYGGTPD